METLNLQTTELSSITSQEFVNKINHIAQKAGSLISKVYQSDFAVEIKSDQSPLTEADLASHQSIVNALTKLTPNIPILSEESANIPWEERSLWDAYWLIDPLDGTKEFIKRNGEFTVNIALIHQGAPIVGVVYAPELELLYFASIDIGAWKRTSNVEATKIGVAGKPVNQSYRIMGSRSHQSEDFKDYIKQFESFNIVSMGSSLKLCYVAEGKADIYPRLGLTSEWDTAAAHAIVKFAGGECLNYETNKELKYNTKDSLLNPYFIVTGYKG